MFYHRLRLVYARDRQGPLIRVIIFAIVLFGSFRSVAAVSHSFEALKVPLCREQLQPACAVGYEPVAFVRRPRVSEPTDDAAVELSLPGGMRCANGNLKMPTAWLVAEVPSGQTNRPERLDDAVRLAGPYHCHRALEAGRRNSGRSLAPILPDLAP